MDTFEILAQIKKNYLKTKHDNFFKSHLIYSTFLQYSHVFFTIVSTYFTNLSFLVSETLAVGLVYSSICVIEETFDSFGR